MITYAEIHYRPSFIPSLISLKQPEIVFDAPSRIEYGYPVPLFLIVKDSDRFPVNLDSIVIHLRYEDGVEKPRVEVVLATQIPEETCKKINLGYRDPNTINVDEWKDREDEGILYVPKAGEMLHRLKDDPFKK